MTEPVAYLHKSNKNKKEIYLEFGVSDNKNFDSIPLYTNEQLHPRVKMTQAEFDEFNSMPVFASVYGAMLALYSGNVIRYSMLLKRFSGNDGQIEFANLWFHYRIKHKAQGELIEIVSNMKWFVRSKSRDDEGDYAFLSGIETPDDWGYSKRHDGVNEPGACAYAFDTQDEAELWVTPLTEAVQLPVEGE